MNTLAFCKGLAWGLQMYKQRQGRYASYILEKRVFHSCQNTSRKSKPSQQLFQSSTVSISGSSKPSTAKAWSRLCLQRRRQTSILALLASYYAFQSLLHDARYFFQLINFLTSNFVKVFSLKYIEAFIRCCLQRWRSTFFAGSSKDGSKGETLLWTTYTSRNFSMTLQSSLQTLSPFSQSGYPSTINFSQVQILSNFTILYSI